MPYQSTKIMIIKEVLGTESAIKLLDIALRDAGIDKEQCFIISLKDNPNFNPAILVEAPNVIIALGNIPLKVLTGKDSILKWRGSILPYTMPFNLKTIYKVLPAIQPETCFKQWSYYQLLVFDLKKAKKESTFPEIRKQERQFKINPTFEEILTEINRLKKEAEYISEDIETYKGSGIIRCVGLTDKIDTGFTIPFVNAYTTIWTTEEEIQIWQALQKLLLYSNKKIVVQNASFEQKILEPWLDGMMPIWMDTMRAHALIYPELPHNLGFLGSIYTDMPYWKDREEDNEKASGDSVNIDELQEYNGKDVCGTLEIAFKLEQELKECEMHDFYHNYDKKLSTVLVSLEKTGIPVSRTKVVELRQERLNKLKELENEFQALAGDVNVRSSKQMKKFLYEDLALPVQYKKRTDKVTASEDAILKLAKKSNNPALKKIIEIRNLKHDLSSFLFLKTDKKKGYIDELPFQLGTDERLHTEYGITETGRLSSKADIFGKGTNLQNQPEELRVMFKAPEGMLFVKADLEQAEDRVTAWLANETTLKALYTKGIDTHCYKAVLANPKLKESCIQCMDKKCKDRQTIKSIAHGWNYGRGAKSIAEELGLTKKEVEIFIQKLNATFPNIPAWHLKLQQQLKATRTLITPFGRKRTFMGRWGDDLFREAYAFVPQSTVADYTNKALLRLCALYNSNIKYTDEILEFIKRNMNDITLQNVKIIHQCHDEILALVCQDLIKDYIPIARSIIEQSFWCGSGLLTIPVDIKVGKTWGECEKWKY